MPRADHLYVFAYDVQKDSVRARVAALLENELVRVQRSVFEGRLSAAEAKRLAREIAACVEPADNLRIYAITEVGLESSLAVGGPPLPEKSSFLLL